jgi:hypothetical protein
VPPQPNDGVIMLTRKFKQTFLLLSFLSSLIFSSYAMAANVDETCLNHGQALDIINTQVLNWKTSTANAFMARARIEGTVDQVFPDHSGHRHFSLKIGPALNDHIEVIYNLSFGNLPVPAIGATVEACGDYITSIAQTGAYPPSPDGGIIHWVHRSPHGHEAGYVILNGVKF